MLHKMQSRFLAGKRFTIVLVLICTNLWLNAVTYEVKQDGSEDFITIQEGIDASANADTVLVHPGTYYENINFNGKNITVASLYLTTLDEQYLNQTIINGNQTGSCVRIMSGEDETTLLCGFTLTNGSGSPWYEGSLNYGGGILLIDTQVSIKKCSIKNNHARSGGGILCKNSQITLIGVDILNNNSYWHGGGIFISFNSTLIFSQTELCNIYRNFSANGCEISKAWDSPSLDVIVDTFTVFNPDGYFILSTTSTGTPLNDVTLNMCNAKLEPVNADLYVSTNGDNNNSGLTAAEPLKNINFALSLVKSDSLHPNTIHIADGIYSNSLNNDCFSLNMRGYVSLIGESMENTIFDAEENSPHIHDYYSKRDYLLKNITLLNGNGIRQFASSIHISAHQQQNKFVNLENITITDCFSDDPNMTLSYMDLSIKNIHAYSNESTLLSALNSFQEEQEVIIENAYIHGNSQWNPADEGSDAGSQLSFGMLGTEPMNVTITNMELTDNIQTQSDWPESSSGVSIGDNVNLNLVNCTIGNNSSPGNGGAVNFFPGQNSTINIYNSILYGNCPGEIYIDNEFPANPCTLNVQNSLVYGGELGIGNVYSWNVVNWNEGNLSLFSNPLWDVTGENPYALTPNSPCIDAGTSDLPEGVVLSEFDLAGNPRIVGETIDMGCYEWQCPQNTGDYELPVSHNFQLANFPNPFTGETTISFSLTTNLHEKARIEIFNIKGQKIENLQITNSPNQEIIWDANNFASGVYLYKLVVDDKTVDTKKMILLK